MTSFGSFPELPVFAHVDKSWGSGRHGGHDGHLSEAHWWERDRLLFLENTAKVSLEHGGASESLTAIQDQFASSVVMKSIFVPFFSSFSSIIISSRFFFLIYLTAWVTRKRRVPCKASVSPGWLYSAPLQEFITQHAYRLYGVQPRDPYLQHVHSCVVRLGGQGDAGSELEAIKIYLSFNLMAQKNVNFLGLRRHTIWIFPACAIVLKSQCTASTHLLRGDASLHYAAAACVFTMGLPCQVLLLNKGDTCDLGPRRPRRR